MEAKFPGPGVQKTPATTQKSTARHVFMTRGALGNVFLILFSAAHAFHQFFFIGGYIGHIAPDDLAGGGEAHEFCNDVR